jgi:hypothetical protein
MVLVPVPAPAPEPIAVYASDAKGGDAGGEESVE